MFERFTVRARRCVVLAAEEARDLGHNYIGSEHVLLGLAREGEGVAAQALDNVGFTTDYIRDQIERGTDVPSGHIPFTSEAKATIEKGLREALQLGHNYIGTEHLLLGIVRVGEGAAVEILNAKTDLDTVRKEVIDLLVKYAPPVPERVLTQQEARAALLPNPSFAMDAVLVCTSALDLLESPRDRAAALAFLMAWYSRA